MFSICLACTGLVIVKQAQREIEMTNLCAAFATATFAAFLVAALQRPLH